MTVKNILNDMIIRRDRLLNDAINHSETVGYVYIRPYNLGLIVEQLTNGVQVSPAMGGKLPTIFSEQMANANLHIVKSILNEQKVEIVSIQKYISDSIESTNNTINLINSNI